MPKLKALPKALIVGAVLAGVGFTAYKFMPERRPVATIAETPVQATPPVVEATPQRVEPVTPPVVAETPSIPAATPTEPATVSNGGTGLDAVLKAGKK